MTINWRRAALAIGVVLCALGSAPAAAGATTATDEPASFKKFGTDDREANSEKISR